MKVIRKFIGWGILMLALVFSGCQAAYYGQAIRGHTEIWTRTRAVDRVLADPDSGDELHGRIHLTREILAFAETELLLPNDGNYTTYADLERDYVVWSVFAAPELSVEPHTWRYPVFGELAYRGYYRKEAAEACAARLRKRGLDVAIGEVPAYSTLGWFRDPLLNTFIFDEEPDLAGLIFHELAHKKQYWKGDTEYSEAFAVAVEEEGVRRWLAAHGTTAERREYAARRERLHKFVDRVLKTRDRLEEIYASPVSEAEKRARKRLILADFQEEVRALLKRAGRDVEDSFWLRDDLNNAHLNIVSAYYERLPLFRDLLKECEGDLACFYETAATITPEELPDERPGL